MPYELVFTDTAIDDLQKLVGSLRPEVQDQALDAIEAACRAFIERPPFRAGHLATPTFPLHFSVRGTTYYWVAAYSIGADEKTFSVEHVFRVPL